MKEKFILLGDSGSLEGIKKIISEFYYSSNIVLEQREEKIWLIKNANGIVNNVRVFKKKRGIHFVYRFEYKEMHN